MNSHKAIVFDFGNVIIDINYQLTLNKFAEITGKQPERIRKQFLDSQLFRRYETGLFEDEDFREIVRQTLGFPFSEEEIDAAWNALLGDVPPHRIQLILALRKRFSVYLLSNTNSIHIQACNQYFKSHFGIPSVANLFDKAFYSYEMNLWKPDPEIYLAVIDGIGLKPEEILFIDDLPDNIDAAKKLGIQTILHNPTTHDIKDYFD